jgi:outer membrane protein assembly factor BamB
VADGRLYFGAFSNNVADSPLPTWPEFYKKYDKDGDGIVAFAEIAETSIDYWRGVDANRDGKFSKEDWDLMDTEARAVRSENVMLAVQPGGTGNITETHVAWRYRKALPYVATPLHYRDRLYFVRDGGILSSLHAQTGEPHYAQERLPGAPGAYYASPVAADGRLYLLSVAGKLTVVAAGGEKPEVLHQADFRERVLATPAIAGHAIYVRTDKRLWAFGR